MKATAHLCGKFVESRRAERAGSWLLSFGEQWRHGKMISCVHCNDLIDDSELVIETLELPAHTGETLLDGRLIVLISSLIEDATECGREKLRFCKAALARGRSESLGEIFRNIDALSSVHGPTRDALMMKLNGCAVQ